MMRLPFIFVFFLVAFSANAQTYFGLTGGYSNSWIEKPPYFAHALGIHLNGLQVSALTYTRLNKTFYLGVEPGLVNRTSADPNAFFSSGPERMLLNYVELPLMLSFKFPSRGSKWEISAKAGYGISALLRAYGSIIEFEEPIRKGRLEHSNGINYLDHGLYTGFMVEYYMVHVRLILNTNFYMGMNDVVTYINSKNRTLNINLGYLIRL